MAASSLSFQYNEFPFVNEENEITIIQYHAVKSIANTETSFFEKYKTPIIFAIVMVVLQVIKNRLRGAQQ